MENGSKPQIVEFQLWHLLAVESREQEPREILLAGMEKLKQFPNIAFSAELAGQIVGCGGMVLYDGDLGYPWVMISDELAKYPVWLHRAVRRCYRRVIEEFHVKRLYSEAAICSERNTRWLQSFGFKPDAGHFEVNGREYLRHECEVG